jgi:serine/threonine protein kinase
MHNIAFGLEILQFRITRIVHRDLKPENILLSESIKQWQRLLTGSSTDVEHLEREDFIAKISDFGVSVRMPLVNY